MRDILRGRLSRSRAGRHAPRAAGIRDRGADAGGVRPLPEDAQRGGTGRRARAMARSWGVVGMDRFQAGSRPQEPHEPHGAPRRGHSNSSNCSKLVGIPTSDKHGPSRDFQLTFKSRPSSTVPQERRESSRLHIPRPPQNTPQPSVRVSTARPGVWVSGCLRTGHDAMSTNSSRWSRE